MECYDAPKSPSQRPSAAKMDAPPPMRPSQIVRESEAKTPTGQHITVTLERQSTGGTRYEESFKKGAGRAMTAAERQQKARTKRSLFPEKGEAERAKDAERKRAEREAAAERKRAERKAAWLARPPAERLPKHVKEELAAMRYVHPSWPQYAKDMAAALRLTTSSESMSSGVGPAGLAHMKVRMLRANLMSFAAATPATSSASAVDVGGEVSLTLIFREAQQIAAFKYISTCPAWG